MSSVEQIKERLSVEEVIGSYIKLEKAGNNFKARCPFHNEKTPSFFVSPDRGSYYCFGCAAKGDIFSFVENFENIDFLGALKILANRAGVELEFGKFEKNDKKERLFNLLDESSKLYENNLQKEEVALDYLRKRGLKDATIKEWRIGYAKNEWQDSLNYLKSKKYTEKEIVDAGMAKSENGKTYDRFRGRIMFPIFDSAGRVVAYSGRILQDDGKSAKYLNSPETELFNKSKILYGYHNAKQAIRKFDFSIIVEGQMDLIMCHQAGFNNAVATSGTSLTKDHLTLLQRISNNVIMCFDSDTAGHNATIRAWALALSSNMEVKVAKVTGGKDPADLILLGSDLFKETLKKAVSLIDFLLDSITSELDDKKKIWAKVKEKVLPYIYLLESATEKSRYVSKISEIISIKEEFIFEDLKKVRLDENFKDLVREDIINKKLNDNVLKSGSVERSLASILARENDEKLKEKIRDILGVEFEIFERELEKEKSVLSFEAEQYYANFDEAKMKKEFEHLLMSLKEESLKKELAKLLTELKLAEKSDEQKAISILKRCDDISKLLSKLRK